MDKVIKMVEANEFDVKSSIVDAVVDLFDTMLSMEAKFSDEDSETNLEGLRITGTLGFAGQVLGSINIQVPDTFAQIMTASMLGMEVDEIESDDEINDVILEVCNIIGGNLKSGFNDVGLNCVISTPSITIGNDFEIETLDIDRYERIPFRCQEHIFFVEVSVKATDDVDPEYRVQLKRIDINQFKRLDIISTAGDTVIELFDTMLSMELELADSTIEPSPDENMIMGTINFAGDVTGSIYIRLSHIFARFSTAAILGKKLDEIEGEEEIRDVVGEMSNIIGGNLKAAFCDTGLTCEISPPSLTTGNDFTIKTLNMDRYERFVFRYEEYNIFVEVCVKIDENAQSTGQIEDSVEETDINVLEAEEQSEQMDKQVNDNEKTQSQLKTTDDTVGDYDDTNLDSILDIPVEITVELGQTSIKIDELLELGPGSTIALSKLEGEPLNILVNKKLVARGEVVIDKEKYGIRITEMVSRMDRIKSLR